MRVSTFICSSIFCFLAGCATPSQMYWDHKVKELCEKDGGVTVYEKVELTKEEYKNFGGANGIIPIPSEDSPIAEKYEYLSKNIEMEINHSDPYVRRMEYIVYRKSDKKIIGRFVNYTRIGGDIDTGISEKTHFSCADMKSISLDIEREIFTIKGD